MKTNDCYLGVDIGSISTKAAVVDENNKILASTYLWTEGDPIGAVKRVLVEIKKQLEGKDVKIMGTGTTGSARELIGTILDATIVKNEITAHAVGTLTFHPDVKTIFEIGGQDSKIIILDHGIVVDYAMNTLCAAGTGSFLSSQARRLNIPVEEFGAHALRAKNATKIAGRCTVFAESDLVHKAQMGHPKEDIIAGLCNSIVNNYLNNIGKGKNIQSPIVFQGGVSKNVGVVRSFEKITGHKIIIDDAGHLMGAIGVAILARNKKTKKEFNFNIEDIEFTTVGVECGGCANNCEVICVLKDNKFLDGWGNRCATGADRARLKVGKTGGSFASRILSTKMIAKDTIAVDLAKPENFNFKAGQYVFISIDSLCDKGANESMRAMSIVSEPSENKITLAMRVSGTLFKKAIAGAEVGTSVTIEGPFGDIALSEKISKDVVFVAGGIGITPFISMLRNEAKAGWPRKIYLFYSNRNIKGAAFFEELSGFKNDNFIFIPTISGKDDPEWKGERGRLTGTMMSKYVPDLVDCECIIVGMPEMVRAVYGGLRTVGVSEGNIKVESFVAGEQV